MKDFFLDKFEYNFSINQKIIQSLIDNKDKLNDRILTLITHTLNAHHIWNARLLNKPIIYKTWDVYDYEIMLKLDLDNYNDSLFALKNFEVNEKVNYVTMLNEPFSNSRQDILYHILNHTNYHRAQINSELKNLGLQAIISDFIFYKRQ